jgi:2-polyprenyl-3-methyl-5-hydroxy-6-metoxy-1,4-benzoquinol methylase
MISRRADAEGLGKDSIVSPYFDHLRTDILDAIPADAKRLLSIGCGAGRTEAELVRRGMVVVGVEVNPQAAQAARHRGLTVLEGDAMQLDVNVDAAPYDCIVYADVLEHLADPISLLRRHVASLRPGGIVYVTVPNFRNWQVFWELFIKGHVTYREAGILDYTHLRITTRKMVLEWFQATGLEPVQTCCIIRGPKKRFLSMCTLGLMREFIAPQIALVGKKRSAPILGSENGVPRPGEA